MFITYRSGMDRHATAFAEESDGSGRYFFEAPIVELPLTFGAMQVADAK